MSPWTSASLASLSMFTLGMQAREQLRLRRRCWPAGLDLLPQALRFLFLAIHVGIHFGTAPEVIGDDGVGVGQVEGVVGLNHLFRRHAVFVLLDDRVEGDAAVTDANGAAFIHSKRKMFRR